MNIAASDARPVNTLIIEDNPADLRLISIYLEGVESYKFNCSSAGSLQDAADKISEQNFDLIFLDLGLPDGSGGESVKKLLLLTDKPAIVVMTGLYDEKIALEAIHLGAQDFLIKGDASSKVLKRTITNALQRNELKRELDKSREIFHTVIETANDAIITTSDSLTINSWNRAAMDIFGYDKNSIIGQSIFVLFHDKVQSSVRRHFSTIFDTSNTHAKNIVEYAAIDKYGIEVDVEVSLASWQTEDERHCSLVIRNVTERKKLDLVKTEFISTVSHELRTPLTALLGSLKLVLGGVTGAINEKTSEMLELSRSNGERLLLLINDILDMSKIENGQINILLTHESVQKIVESALLENQGYASQYNIDFKLCSNEPSIKINIDKTRMLQILANFLSNAAKYSPVNETVSINIDRVENNIRISVTDKGPGIPENFKAQVYDKFTQSDSSTTRKVGGTGLGLHISKILVEKMHGNIGFFSTPNVATTFFAEFPEVTQDQ